MRGLVVHVPRGEQLTPDHQRPPAAPRTRCATAEDLADRALPAPDDPGRRPGLRPARCSSGAGTVAVVTGFLSPGLDPEALGLQHTLSNLAAASSRTSCTSTPRCSSRPSATPPRSRSDVAWPARCTTGSPRRWPRSATWSTTSWPTSVSEPDVPGAGAAAPGAARTAQRRGGRGPRSVRTLRTSVGENESLGTAIGSLARHLSGGSGVPIQVTLDESTQRLRPRWRPSCCASPRRP